MSAKIIYLDDQPEAVYPGHAEIDQTGARLALQMLRCMENEDPENSDGVTVMDDCQLENWPRRGRPFRNLVAEYLEKARAAGPEAANGFYAVLTGYISETMMGCPPDIEIFEQWYGEGSRACEFYDGSGQSGE